MNILRPYHALGRKVSLSLIVTLCLFVAGFVVSGCGGGGGGGGSETIDSPDDGGSTVDNDSDVDEPSEGRVWTVAEILAEPVIGGAGGAPLCGGEFGFRRCTCAPDVPSTVRYRPSVEECPGQSAAAILSGDLLDAFSIVVRDTQNRDRWPAAGSGFGGCSAELADSDSPPARCSAFKVQAKFDIGGGTARVYCFGASGYSDIFADAARLTIKLSNDPFSNDDDIVRHCLAGPDLPLN